MYSQTGKASLPLSQTTCTLRAVLRSKTWSPDKKKKRAEQRATKRCHYRFWRFFDCNEKKYLGCCIPFGNLIVVRLQYGHWRSYFSCNFYDSPTTGLVETSIQGYSSMTCIATLSNGNSIVLQFGPSNRAIDEDLFKTAHMQIGVYELLRIAGFAFRELHKVLNFI